MMKNPLSKELQEINLCFLLSNWITLDIRTGKLMVEQKSVRRDINELLKSNPAKLQENLHTWYTIEHI